MWKTELSYRKRKTGIEEKISMPVFLFFLEALVVCADCSEGGCDEDEKHLIP